MDKKKIKKHIMKINAKGNELQGERKVTITMGFLGPRCKDRTREEKRRGQTIGKRNW